MHECFFVSDLHGRIERYEKLFDRIVIEKPKALFMGGDLLPLGAISYGKGKSIYQSFVDDFLVTRLVELKAKLDNDYPRIFVIMGNDDPRSDELSIVKADSDGIWEYVHNKKTTIDKWRIYGYSYVPPTPFLLKDWERYDVSRFIDPGCIPPEYGKRTVPVPDHEIKYATIQKDLDKLAGTDGLDTAVFLFHSPPYQTKLDRAALDGRTIDHVPLDVHVGSVAIKRFIKKHQPRLTLHGHIHESARLTGSWRDKIGNTYMFSGAHDGPELAIVKFDLENLDRAERELI